MITYSQFWKADWITLFTDSALRYQEQRQDGKKLDIPSYLTKVGDVISIKDKSRSSEKIKAVLESTDGKIIPKWLDLDNNTLSGKVIAVPERDDIDIDFEEHLIVELYSR